jgi:hypothetical protein
MRQKCNFNARVIGPCRVHLRHDLRFVLRFDLQIVACVIM